MVNDPVHYLKLWNIFSNLLSNFYITKNMWKELYCLYSPDWMMQKGRIVGTDLS